MAEIVDFGLQKHKIKMDSRYFDNVLSVVAGDTGRRIEVQLLDTNGMVQNTTGLKLRLNAEVEGKATYTDATLVDATTGKYQLDLSNGMFLAPGNWQFQWQITDSVGKKLHSFAFTGNVGKNISEGGSQATNFYLNLDDLKAMQEDLVNGTFDSEALETNISEKLTNLESEYAPKLTEVTAQLAQTEQEVILKTRSGKSGLPKLISFITDDGRKGELDLGQVFIDNGVPLNGCIITDFPTNAVNANTHMSWEEIKNFQNNHGFEYGTHTVNVSSNLLDGYTEEEIDYQLSESKRVLEEKLERPCNYFVYPQGIDNLTVRNISRKYYRASVDTLGGINQPPVLMHPLSRVSADAQTLAEMKAEVDKLENMENGWLVFMVHTTQDRQGDYSKYAEILPYIASVGIPVVTISKGLEHYENKIDVGDFSKIIATDGTYNRSEDEKHVMIGADGELFSEKLDYYSRKITGNYMPPISKKPSEYFLNTTTHEYINNSFGSSEGYPFKMGGLQVTINLDKQLYSTGLFYPIDGSQPWIRKATSSDTWSEYKPIGATNINNRTDMVSESTPLLNFHKGITYSNVISTQFGEGTLITYNVDTAKIAFQEFHPVNSNIIYKRKWDWGANVWLGFYSINKKNTVTLTTSSFTIPTTIVSANSMSKTKITWTGVGINNRTKFLFTTNYPLPDGVSCEIMTSYANEFTIRLFNVTTSDITISGNSCIFSVTALGEDVIS